jgi:transposase InsO family protein
MRILRRLPHELTKTVRRPSSPKNLVEIRVDQAHVGWWKTNTMCRVLMVSKAGFYAWRQRPTSERGKRDATLHFHVIASHRASKGRYGSRPIRADLRDLGERCSRKRVVRIMHAAGLCGKQRKAFRSRPNPITRSPLPQPARSEVLAARNRQSRSRVGRRYHVHQNARGWLYLAVLLDLFSRRVIGWSMSHRIEARLVLDALQMGIDRGRSADKVLSHSDRGSRMPTPRFNDSTNVTVSRLA